VHLACLAMVVTISQPYVPYCLYIERRAFIHISIQLNTELNGMVH
jgi:hypothetical protein